MLLCSSLSAQWLEMHAAPDRSVWATSSLTETLGEREVTYGPEALFDGDLSSPWVEGAAGGGFGESVTVLTNRPVVGFSLINGFVRYASLFRKNNRIRSLEVDLLIGFTAPGLVSETDYILYFLKEIEAEHALSVEDSPDRQYFDFPLDPQEQFELYRTVLLEFADDNPMLFRMMLEEAGLAEDSSASELNQMLLMELYGFFAFRMTISDIYPGSVYDDTCLTELQLVLEEF